MNTISIYEKKFDPIGDYTENLSSGDLLDLTSYQFEVRKIRMQNQGQQLRTNSLTHTGKIIEELFLSAKQSIKIVSGDLNGKIYGINLIEESVKFLNFPNSRIEILLDSVLNENLAQFQEEQPLLKTLNKLGYDDNQIHLGAISQSDTQSHFILIDDSSYYFKEDKLKTYGFSAWGDRENSQTLKSMWDDLKYKSHF